MSKQPTITSLQQIRDLESKIESSAQRTTESLAKLLLENKGLQFLHELRFRQKGVDPLEEKRPLNLIEQLNQTFSYLTSLRGVAFLFERHPDVDSFCLNLGTAQGPDIISADRSVAAETFAAVRPENNNKLKKDIRKVADSDATYKYVLFHCPDIPPGPYAHNYGHPDVTVMSVALFG